MSQVPAFVPSVSLVNSKPAVTSLKVAEHFGKRHDHVVRDIRRLISECESVPFSGDHLPNFGEVLETVERPDGSKIEIPVFTIHRDGFMLLVMGYTGKKALQIKLAYIEAFNAMEAKLAGKAALPPKEDPERVQLASMLAAAAASQISRSVYDTVMAGRGDGYLYEKWKVTLGHKDRAHVKLLSRDTIITTFEELIEKVASPRCYLGGSNEDFIKLSAACLQRIAERCNGGLL